MRRLSLPLVLALTSCAAGSSDGGSSSATDSGSSDVTPRDGSTETAADTGAVVDDGGFSIDAPTFDAISGDGCAEDTKRVYVVSKAKELHRFDPAALTFTKVGALTCPAGTATPFSMAIDRAGVAWILYNDGHIFHASTKDASCTATKYVADQLSWHTFGMAFAADAPGSSSETLYVAEIDKALGKIDTKTLTLSAVGEYGKTSVPAELTGRADGKLFAFFQRTAFSTAGSRISELDPKTGKILAEKNPPSVDVGSGWAFAHWGGTYWLFTAPGGTNSIVQEYDYDAGTTKTVVADVGFKIVGAGVSTCAPTARPK